MADRPRTGDDDEAPRLSEVTVPPWLRTGPTPDHAMPGVPAAGRSAGGAGGSDAARAGSGEREPSADAPPPTRITLGAVGDAHAPATSELRSPAGPAGSGSTRREADDLSTLSLGAPPADRGRPDDEPPPAPAVLDRRPARIALLAAAGVAVLGGSAVLGFVVTRGAVSPADERDTGCVEVAEPGRVVGSGPGSLETPAGAVLAFDHAYYVERSAEKAFEAVAPSSRMTEEQLRVEGVERVPEGTTHCVDVRELSPTLLEVDLTEYPPGADPVLIRQRVRVAENPGGTWGIVSITPAG
ncbi:hypothetical protein [Dietzia kunjamensis]|uniref:hypothetical protein n=1 Tax=Dietzia kunjamensis TaxID=322509 RepID=UPI0020972AA4|nr:hypothetical protein [Dietzia kunjamensis]USX46172.1 hypothetical protein NHB83_01250 [Dietzia kunjamensis]